ncbi:hypothetical protein [Streptomyces sp. NRRL F-5630]|uniref:hypothetical protein n=1 Tax=Streptomyces sp. NRRL F-5630 TaxID=1463864 RepID=UPI003EC10CD3
MPNPLQAGQAAEPTDQELRDLAAEHDIALPSRPSLPLVRRRRFDDLSDDLVAVLVALAKAKEDVRYWMSRSTEAHDRAAGAELSATATRAAYDVANDRADRAAAERDELRSQLKHHREDEQTPQPTGTAHHTSSAAELAQHLEDECEPCTATLPDRSLAFLTKVAHAAQDAGAPVALLLIIQDLDRRGALKKEATR